jgi:tagaturonate reductase
MTQLKRKTWDLKEKKGQSASIDQLFALPEKVLQFGTGVLLRGLPDYFIDKANKQKLFNGRVVVVKSTSAGDTDAFTEQDGLYTILESGVVDGERSEKVIVNASISRVLSAKEEWDQILQCALYPAMQVIISNTTEVGITLELSDALAEIPISFPGRLLHFLLARFNALGGTKDSGMVIIPTELIVDNGTKLKEIILTLAKAKGVSEECLLWLSDANDFCNSLVDCIVPGKLSKTEQAKAENELGYEDKLLIMSEPYRLWAIETSSERTRKILSFSGCDKGVILAPDISKFRELKLRLLNATHTLSCGLAYLSGFTTVKEAMADESFASFINELMLQDIAPLVAQKDISYEEAKEFALQVIDRFKNPFIEHLWLNISVQYTSKLAMRVAPLICRHYSRFKEVPEHVALGIAAYILFMRSDKFEKGTYFGQLGEKEYTINDDKANLMHRIWLDHGITAIVTNTLSNEEIFGADLSKYPGFTNAVTRSLSLLMDKGAAYSLQVIFAKNIEA